MTYTLEEHRHRFGAWAASRAASVNGCRFSVESGRSLIEEAQINVAALSPNDLPSEQNQFDLKHKEWRDKIIVLGKQQNITISHGVAAKLINVYLKSMLVCAVDNSCQAVPYIHPPIDSLLLDELAEKDSIRFPAVWSKYVRIRWSKLSSDEYQDLIDTIRLFMDGKPLWAIEEYWRGFQ